MSLSMQSIHRSSTSTRRCSFGFMVRGSDFSSTPPPSQSPYTWVVLR